MAYYVIHLSLVVVFCPIYCRRCHPSAINILSGAKIKSLPSVHNVALIKTNDSFFTGWFYSQINDGYVTAKETFFRLIWTKECAGDASLFEQKCVKFTLVFT